jgi:hypothetical protein
LFCFDSIKLQKYGKKKSGHQEEPYNKKIPAMPGSDLNFRLII